MQKDPMQSDCSAFAFPMPFRVHLRHSEVMKTCVAILRVLVVDDQCYVRVQNLTINDLLPTAPPTRELPNDATPLQLAQHAASARAAQTAASAAGPLMH